MGPAFELAGEALSSVQVNAIFSFLSNRAKYAESGQEASAPPIITISTISIPDPSLLADTPSRGEHKITVTRAYLDMTKR